MSKVTTFYSYKGGSGRSMTMANVAWALATNGERVLAVDWDLEAPGLHRYFHPFLRDPEQSSSDGLVDRIWTYIEELGAASQSSHDRASRFALAQCEGIVQPLELPTRSKGCLHLLGAGRQDEFYSDKVSGLDWNNFYARFDGERFINQLIDWARNSYSHILIDSRTGVADTAGICTAQVPDAVVMCLVYNRQSIEGSAAIARSILKTRNERGMPSLVVRVVPCRVEERGVVEAARRYAAGRLGDALSQSRGTVERALRRDEIRHYPWCAFEEKLAVFEDVPDERGSLLDMMHELARQITDRKKLRIEDIDAKVLASIWRRAAFDDPRIADLELLGESSLDEAYTQLMAWVDAALEDREERPDWLMALGEAAVSFAARGDDRHATSTAEFLARSGLDIARRAVDADAPQYTIRYALLLQSRASQLQKAGQYDEAFNLAHQSYGLLEAEGTPLSRWRAARSLERMAEISLAADDPIRAIAIYRDVALLLGSLHRRDLPLGAALDPARSLRILAEQLLAHGDAREAEEVSERAIRHLHETGLAHSRREVAEVVNILSARAEIAASVGSDTADREIMKVRTYASDAIESRMARSQLNRRLDIAEARLRIRRADFDAAVQLLDRAAEMDPPSAIPSQDILELRVGILLEAGFHDKAADILLKALREDKITPGPEFLKLLRRSLAAAGREGVFDTEMLKLLKSGDRRQSALFNTAVEWLVSSDSSLARGEEARIQSKGRGVASSRRPRIKKVED